MDCKNYSDVDITTAMDHLILAATELGLGTFLIEPFDPVAVSKLLGLPNDEEQIPFTPLGYADDQPSSRGRKHLFQLVNYEHLY